MKKSVISIGGVAVLIAATFSLWHLKTPQQTNAEPTHSKVQYPSENLIKNNLWVLPDDQLKDGSNEIVLLVTGANNTGSGAWAWSYAAQLPKQNYIPATITLPNMNSADLNYSGKFVYEAVAQLHRDYPQKNINIIAHSLGNLATSWALHYRPTFMAKHVKNYVALGAPFKGIQSAGFDKMPALASNGQTQVPINFQVKAGSEFVKHINSTPFPKPIRYLSIISQTDEIAAGQSPEHMASFPKGTEGETVTPQAIYQKPDMLLGHVEELADNGIYEIATSFLEKREINPAAADQKYYPEMQKSGLDLTILYGNTKSHTGDAKKVEHEPISTDIIE